MIQIFGDYIEDMPPSQEYLIIGFSPGSTPLKQRWRNNGLSADFLAEYLTTFFPCSDDDPNSINKQAEIKSAVSYIANELLENAMKFSYEKSPDPITIELHLDCDTIVFTITNNVHPQEAEKFQCYIKELTTSDLDELYIRQVEKNLEDENNSHSGLGLLTMINDYMAKLGWKFETVQQNPETISVTTMVQLRILTA